LAGSHLEVGAPRLGTGIDGAVAAEVVVAADIVGTLALAFGLLIVVSALEGGSAGQAGSSSKENGNDGGVHD